MVVLSGQIKRVACAISGGVDSAVSAFLLKKRGFDVVGVFMTNWDRYEETSKCSIDEDYEDAQFICRKLGIDFVGLNFVKEYWNEVFVPTVDAYIAGKTPNPDILCNRSVKFKKLAETTLKTSENGHPNINADAFATGHYAQNSFGNFLENRPLANSRPRLLRSVDSVKDQTFWLCNISWRHLQHCMFPIGNLTKPEVKRIASSVGLENIAKRKESMGICFIGKRNFNRFIDSYIEPMKGQLRNLETGAVVGEHTGVHHFTIGQKVPGFTYGQEPYFIAKLLPQTQEVFIVHGRQHPSLFMKKCVSDPPIWISEDPPALPSNKLSFQWQNKWRAVSCFVKKHATEAGLSISLEKPMRCIAPGQYAAFYNENICLGGAIIKSSTSLYDEGQREFYTDWRISDFEFHYDSPPNLE